MANQNKNYVIQMEVTQESIKDLGINPKEVSYQKVGHQTKLVHLIEVEDEQLYLEYMRPEWRELKKLERQQASNKDSAKAPISLDQMYEDYSYEFYDNRNSIEDTVIKQEVLSKLKELLDELDEIDKTIINSFMENKTDLEISEMIGIGRRAVNKRRHKIFSYLRSNLEDYK